MALQFWQKSPSMIEKKLLKNIFFKKKSSKHIFEARNKKNYPK